MNGIEALDVGDEKADRLCELLVADSAAEYGFEPGGRMHPSGEKLLHKYFYKKSTGHVEASTSRRETRISEEADGKLEVKPFDEKLQLMKGGGPLMIKNENPAFVEFENDLKVLLSALKALEKQWTDCQNVQAKMAAQSAKDPSLKIPAADLKACNGTLGKFLDDMREFAATAGVLTADDDLGDYPKEMQKYTNVASNHLDGAKGIKKRMLAKLQ